MSAPRTTKDPRLARLAIFGGAPAFAEKLHVGRPNVGHRERFLARVSDVLDRGWLTNDGPYVRAFEKRLAELCGVRHCVAMANATVGLEILFRAVGFGGQVIVPAFTFVATAHALQWQEIEPVFCDVDPETHCIDPDRVEDLITPRTTGIVGVHVWGNAAPVEALQEIADRRGLTLVLDAAHALGCTHGGRPIGGFGRAECFSFHATKVVSSFEGGAVTTDDDELAERMRLMRNFGFAGKDRVIYLGSNGKMNEVEAAMGLTSLDAFDEFVAAGRANRERYVARLGALPGVRVHPHATGERQNHHYVVVEIDAGEAGLTRDQLVRVLEAENVLARRYFHPGVHRMEPYRSLQPNAGLLLPETEALTHRVMQLPTGTAVAPDDVDRVCDVVETALAGAAEIAAALGDGE